MRFVLLSVVVLYIYRERPNESALGLSQVGPGLAGHEDPAKPGAKPACAGSGSVHRGWAGRAGFAWVCGPGGAGLDQGCGRRGVVSFVASSLVIAR